MKYKQMEQICNAFLKLAETLEAGRVPLVDTTEYIAEVESITFMLKEYAFEIDRQSKRLLSPFMMAECEKTVSSLGNGLKVHTKGGFGLQTCDVGDKVYFDIPDTELYNFWDCMMAFYDMIRHSYKKIAWTDIYGEVDDGKQ